MSRTKWLDESNSSGNLALTNVLECEYDMQVLFATCQTIGSARKGSACHLTTLGHPQLQVTTPVLKFMAEFVVNKTQRLTFDSSSPNGILLFREVSKLIVSYGTRVLLLPVSSDPYANKYKGIWISLTILKAGEHGPRFPSSVLFAAVNLGYSFLSDPAS